MSAGIARYIEAFATERQVRYLMHFTRLANLDSILAQGLIPRNRLVNKDGCNDDMRLDGTDAICASIEFPNYQMFYRLRQENPDVQWVVVVINAAVLWKTRVAFCQCNAASNLVTDISIAERMTLQAFRAMYDDFGEKRRVDLGILDKLPTHPQAEVLLLDGVPRDAILGVIVEKEDLKQRLEAAYPGLIVRTIPGYFSPRKDFKHWKKAVA
ncbi:hypothetical protein GCM10007862_28800 [Dyella lipolytica]|uniref:DUF4433 domain-containing protein n=1 Tax=Dyella lipolytica TaxID=1867835 RepID=A0ABW8IVH1_9GAMM|nr:DarT ssDNA thymidine ADP-ribosyltransferase family protein [Dyella lipolytica]GLQ47829.1 hypothetical protein GCM10007862_28800 [Dyella lipolytica]